MSDAPVEAALRALREAFDASFAAAPGQAPERVAVLALRAGGEPLAVRVLDVAGLLPAGRIVPVPSRRPELLGVTGLRGAAVPVYALARLVGRGSAEEPRWTLLAGHEDRVAFAFEGFEGHAVVPAADVLAAEPEARAHVAGAVRLGGEARTLLDVASLVRAVTGR